MSCLDGDIIVWDGVALAWTCDLDADSVLTEAEVVAMVTANGFALTSDLATVAMSGDYDDLLNIPAEIADGDADTLADISCSTTQVIKWNGANWACADDTVLDEADVDAFVSNNGFASASDIFSGAWSALTGVPSWLSDGDDDTLAGLTCGDQQVALWNASGGNWYCGDDKLLTASEVQAMVEAMTGLSLPADTTLDGDALLTNASTLAVDMLDTAGAVDGDVLSFDGLNAGWSESVAGAGCVVDSISDDGNYTLLDCGGLKVQGLVARSLVEVSAGDYHTCGIDSAGYAHCWGADNNGESRPPAGTFSSISAGSGHTCGIDSSGAVQCWGADGNGETFAPAGTFSSISTGHQYTCGVDSGGSVQCWGRDDYGQSTPPGGTFSSIDAGNEHTCGIDSSGSVQCWGRDIHDQSSPPGGTFSSISAGYDHTCGIDSSGSVQCWGYDNYGQGTPPAGTFSSVSAGHEHTCGIDSSGSVQCWGRDNYGQSSPPGGTFSSISTRLHHNCGIDSSGTVQCWGDAGQISIPHSFVVP
jgi:hypothetical protein